MPVLAICLDAADRRQVLDWADAGELPTLAHLIETGASAELRSPALHLPESVWPTVSTGCWPGKNGHYNFRVVRPGSYSQVPAPGRSYRRSIWELVADRGRRALLIDVPYADSLGDERVIQLSGWGQRGVVFPHSWPPDLLEGSIARHGRYSRWLWEDFDRSLRAERRHLSESLRMTAARTELLREMLDEHEWDLALAPYWEVHSAAHVFHRYVDPSHLHYDPDRAQDLGDALLKVYKQIDQGLAELIAALPSDTEVVAFSPYGLRPNSNGRMILPRVLEGLGYTVPRPAPPVARAAHFARATLPWSIRRHVNARLSDATRMRMTERMFADSVDWSRTRAVAESEFGHGWIRINLRGREPQGTVEPGADYERLCEEIAGELLSLVDAESEEPAITEVVRTRELLDGPHVDELPDLLLLWKPDRVLRAARHPRLGLIEEDMRDLPKTEHTAEGFMIAAGPQIRSGVELSGAGIVDLAPTLLYLLGLPTPEEMDGRVLDQLIDPETLERRPVRTEPIPWEDERWAAREAA
jgi:predicted AlkP superfamily phosphohydrolase/phosphomutase